MRSYNELQEEKSGFMGVYFKIECPFCHEWYVYSHLFDNIAANTVLFEPEEIEFDSYLLENREMTPYKCKRLVSSNYMKDIITMTCPICGEKHEYTREQLIDASKKCNYFGDEAVFFELSGKEKEEADKFKEEHSHDEELWKEGKIAYTTIGQQFSYTFTPIGLSNSVTIRCNHCGETKDITDSNNW